ncbi:hypothetical protein [Yimella sp. NH-Cas1]|nr:hypothetical protein [Yimella sp. NH-Cas1]
MSRQEPQGGAGGEGCEAFADIAQRDPVDEDGGDKGEFQIGEGTS